MKKYTLQSLLRQGATRNSQNQVWAFCGNHSSIPSSSGCDSQARGDRFNEGKHYASIPSSSGCDSQFSASALGQVLQHTSIPSSSGCDSQDRILY